ncbi:hypothetical protein [Arthrobacter sp. RAF14]|uniref:hypothetical protein n=1 Tax=Arthrobacter sp. RAF14 TaxID=3233051 RepID=UPI003F8DDDC9
MDQELPPNEPSGLQNTSAGAGTLWAPLLVRSLVALVFGAITVFWVGPSLAVYAYAACGYLLAGAAALLWLSRLSSDSLRTPLTVAAIAQVAAAVVILVLNPHTDAGVTLALSAALAVTGAVEVGLFLKRRTSAEARLLGRDLLISGVVGLGTALLLPFFISLGAHALLGVAGGGAVLTGVLWILGALTLRHDARRSPGTLNA